MVLWQVGEWKGWLLLVFFLDGCLLEGFLDFFLVGFLVVLLLEDWEEVVFCLLFDLVVCE